MINFYNVIRTRTEELRLNLHINIKQINKYYTGYLFYNSRNDYVILQEKNRANTASLRMIRAADLLALLSH